MTDFTTFWEIYPRRVSKKDAEKAWNKLTTEQRFCAMQAIPIHVRYWQLSGTTREYLPYPASWLRGERWEDELEMPQSTNEWWRSASGIEAKAREMNVQARPGEDHQSLKARVLAAMR